MNSPETVNDAVMVLAGLVMIAIAAIAMVTAEGALPIPLATMGIVFVAIGARRRRLHG